MPVTPMAIELHSSASGAATPGGSGGTNSGKGQGHEGRARWWWARSRGGAEKQAGGGEALDALLGGRPLVTLAFSDMVVSPLRSARAPPPAALQPIAPAQRHRSLSHMTVPTHARMHACSAQPLMCPPPAPRPLCPNPQPQMKVEEPLKLELPARAEEARPAGSRAALLATLPPRP
jgi:hypothetical protein